MMIFDIGEARPAQPVCDTNNHEIFAVAATELEIAPTCGPNRDTAREMMSIDSRTCARSELSEVSTKEC